MRVEDDEAAKRERLLGSPTLRIDGEDVKPGPLASSRGADQIGDVTALTDGYSAAFLGAAGIAVAGALLAAVVLRTTKTTAGVPAETRDPVAA